MSYKNSVMMLWEIITLTCLSTNTQNVIKQQHYFFLRKMLFNQHFFRSLFKYALSAVNKTVKLKQVYRNIVCAGIWKTPKLLTQHHPTGKVITTSFTHEACYIGQGKWSRLRSWKPGTTCHKKSEMKLVRKEWRD